MPNVTIYHLLCKYSFKKMMSQGLFRFFCIWILKIPRYVAVLSIFAVERNVRISFKIQILDIGQ